MGPTLRLNPALQGRWAAVFLLLMALLLARALRGAHVFEPAQRAPQAPASAPDSFDL
jgi:hypothetical protein